MNHKCVHERVYLQLFLFRDVAKIFLFWKMHTHIITGGIGFSVLAILLKLPRLNIHANCIKGERVLCKLSNIHMQHMRFTAVFYSTETNSEESSLKTSVLLLQTIACAKMYLMSIDLPVDGYYIPFLSKLSNE